MHPFSQSKLATAVITGNHPYDVPNFHALFRSFENIDPYIQTLEDFVHDWGRVQQAYDVIVFYNMHGPRPSDDETWFGQPLQDTVRRITQSGQGLVMLHHAVLAFLEWKEWADILGMDDRTFDYHMEQQLSIEPIANHPITELLKPWSMQDETYEMRPVTKDAAILLETNHAKSIKTLAWARQHKEARVACTVLGHDNSSWADDNFRRLLCQSILWAGRSI